MKLLLALSVLVIALSVTIEPTSAQTVTDAPASGIKEHFESIGSKIRDAASKVVDRTKSAYKGLSESTPVVNAKNWFSNTWQNIKDKVSS